ncbi:hybrid sensor histidine kinase/response regulator [Opitutus sp. ER46]|uniref:hybrid sensor histidine kinase/response regulator n=1 Tax=Opitutus sp. ER46 TaxID=2161864 RepID=UPI000D2FC066|nr:hybrid sensor histidine kinase/response regulator [Opitutus sp. ER46]PTX94245.1 hybrid sensor histidine kinase/response regulator [Opitutus sp. ER46]
MDSHPTLPSSLRGRRILIADDDRLNIRILAGILRREGYEIADADSGERALTSYAEFQPNLVLLDVMMPGIDGLETCRRLRQQYGEKAAPVIFITAKNDSEDVLAGFNAGGVDYLPKPFNPSEVLARIRTHLQIQQLLDEQLQLVEQLSRANSAKNRFLGMAAHDLRNPLASIRGLAEFLGEGTVGPLNPEQLDLVATIREASHSMLDMVNDLLDVATIEAGELNVSPGRHNLIEVVAKAVALTNMEAARKRTHVVFQPHDTQVVAMIDPAKIKQVVDNLLTNAVKFSPPGATVTVAVRVSSDAQGIILSVRDEGPGIPADERDKLFKDFGRLSVRPTGGEKSTGLGLAICRKIVEAHHGTIEAHNLPERGCEFRVILPSS